MSGELAKIEPRDQRMSLPEMKEQVRILDELLKHIMIKDTHYGTIPGTQKPTLYKPGSEKILSTFRIAASPGEVTDLSTDDEVRYRVRVDGTAQADQTFLGSGIGECSSDEEKYKWRKPVCDAEWDETAIDRRREVWKRGEKGSTYKLKQVRTNPKDVANTVLKMAKKRGQIDMTLTVTAASDVFDQDLEDLPPEVREGVVGEKKETVKPPQEKAAAAATACDLATEPQHRKIRALMSGLGYKKDEEHHKVASSFLGVTIGTFNVLTKNQASQLIDHLEKTAKDQAAQG